jgi:hypothetical protein
MPSQRSPSSGFAADTSLSPTQVPPKSLTTTERKTFVTGRASSRRHPLPFQNHAHQRLEPRDVTEHGERPQAAGEVLGRRGGHAQRSEAVIASEVEKVEEHQAGRAVDETNDLLPPAGYPGSPPRLGRRAPGPARERARRWGCTASRGGRPGQTSRDGIRAPYRAAALGLPKVSLEGTPVLRGIGGGRQRVDPPHHPQGSGHDAQAHPRVPSLQSHQRRHRDPQSLRPRPLRLAATHASEGQVLAELLEGLVDQRREMSQSNRLSRHINNIDVVYLWIDTNSMFSRAALGLRQERDRRPRARSSSE